MASRDEKPIETLRLSDEQKRRLVESVNEHFHQSVEQERRDLRVPYLVPGVELRITQPGGGSPTRQMVLTRNLSRRGISFLIGQFLYPDRPAQILLPTRDREPTLTAGKTIRCRHYAGLIHKCAMLFNEPISLQDFVDPVLLGNKTDSDRGAPLVLVMDPQPASQQMHAGWIEQWGFRTLKAANTDEAFNLLIDQAVEMMLVHATDNDPQGAIVAKRLHAAGYAGRLLVCCTDTGPQPAREIGMDVFLRKPISQTSLREAIEGLLAPVSNVVSVTSRPVRSELASEPTMQPLIRDFADGLNQTIEKLTQAQASPDGKMLQALCLSLKGAGSGYGFPQIVDLSALVLDQLAREQADTTQLNHAVRDLIATLKRVRA